MYWIRFTVRLFLLCLFFAYISCSSLLTFGIYYILFWYFLFFHFFFHFVWCIFSFMDVWFYTKIYQNQHTHTNYEWMNENSERRAYKHTQHTDKTKMHKICFENGIKQPNKITQFVHFGFVSGLSIYILSFLSVFASVGLLYRGQCNASHRQISKSLWICYDQHVLRHTNKYYFSTTTINGTIFKENGEFCAT